MKSNKEGKKLKALREEKGLSLREVARRSGLSPANVSLIENGRANPTLASVRKILQVLGYTFSEFFGEDSKAMEKPVFYGKNMKYVQNGHRKYTFLLPRRRDIRVELLSEEWAVGDVSEMEELDCDVAGCVLEGGPIEIEVEGEGKWKIKAGDSFYIPAGYRHRGTNKGNIAANLLTCYYPPRY